MNLIKSLFASRDSHDIIWDLTGTIGVLELIWTTIGLITFVVSVYALWNAVGDMRLLKRVGRNGIRTLIARGNIRREISRVITQGVFVTIGFWAMIQPPTGDDESIARRFFIAGLFILAEISLAISSLADQRQRHQVIAIMERMERQNPRAIEQLEVHAAAVSDHEADILEEVREEDEAQNPQS